MVPARAEMMAAVLTVEAPIMRALPDLQAADSALRLRANQGPVVVGHGSAPTHNIVIKVTSPG